MVFDVIMGLGISLPVVAATGVGVVTGVAQGVSHQQKENEKAANDVRNGEMKAIGFLVGQVMKQSQGKANPALAQQLIKKQLGI